jgi:hypothetical protein
MESSNARARASDALRSAAAAVTLSASTDIWESLVSHLAEALRVDWALVGTLGSTEQKRVRTLAAWHRGSIASNFEYQIPADPAPDLQSENMRLYLSEASRKLRSAWLKKARAEAFGEIILVTSLGRAFGALAIAHAQQLEDPDLVKSVLQIFALKAAVELERELEEENLYRDLLRQLKPSVPVSA